MKITMKSLIYFIILFLTGCSSFKEDSEIEILPIIQSSQAIEENESMEEAENVENVNFVCEAREIPDADLPVVYDKNRQVYMTCENWDLDLYREENQDSSIQFYIYSLTPVKEEDIQVTIPIKTSYTVSVKACVLEENIEPHVYVSYRVDWKLAQILYEKMKLAYERREILKEERHERVENEAEIREMDLIIETYDKYVNSYKGEWNQLTDEQMPKFYKYEVVISFDKNQRRTEEFEQIRVRVGNDTYVQNIGRVCLHKESLNDVYEDISCEVISTIYNGDNVIQIPIKIEVRPNVKDYIKLNNVQINDQQMNILGASIRLDVSLEEECYYSDDVHYISWNTKEPLAVRETDSITVILYVEDSRREQYEYKNEVIITLDYLRREKQCTKNVLYQMEHIHSDYEVCATVFHGVNVSGYFKYYAMKAYQWEVTEEGVVVTEKDVETTYFEQVHKNIFY